MRIFTTTTTLGALALTTAGLLAACGSDHTTTASDGYCAELKTDKAYFQTLSGAQPDLSSLDEAFSRMHSLAKAAPAAVAQPWATLDGAVTTIEGALDEAGISAEDLVAMQGGDVPPDVDLEKLEALGSRMEALSGQEVDKAAEQIADHAEDSCGIDLQAV